MNDLCDCCEHGGERGIEECAQVLNRKTWQNPATLSQPGVESILTALKDLAAQCINDRVKGPAILYMYWRHQNARSNDRVEGPAILPDCTRTDVQKYMR